MDKNWVGVLIVGLLALALVGNFFYSAVIYGDFLLAPPSNSDNVGALILFFGIFFVAVFLIAVFFQRDWEEEHRRRRRRR